VGEIYRRYRYWSSETEPPLDAPAFRALRSGEARVAPLRRHSAIGERDSDLKNETQAVLSSRQL